VLITGALDRRVFDMLAAGNVQRYGGYSRFLDEMERREAEKDAKLEKELAAHRDDLHRESFAMIDFLHRRKDAKLLHWDGRTPVREM
jgi:hypothetical protein